MLFFSACNLRCPWCHNRDLVLGLEDEAELVSVDTALAHLQKRRAVLSGAVLSGGEPTLYSDLSCLITQIKEMGFSVKLDTNGTNPSVLEKLFQNKNTSPDYIALDLKVAPVRYSELSSDYSSYSSKEENLGEKLVLSAKLIHDSGIPHEFRTLALPDNFITEEDISALSVLADNAPWYFRAFRGGTCIDPAWDEKDTVKTEDISALAQKALSLGKQAVCAAR